MRTHPLLRRSAVLLAVIAVSFAASTAVAAGSAPLAQEQYYSSYSAPDVSGALAQEQYLESYGEPRPLSRPPTQTSAASDGTPWLPIALAAAAGLLVGAVTATLRPLPRRRRAPRAAA